MYTMPLPVCIYILAEDIKCNIEKFLTFITIIIKYSPCNNYINTDIKREAPHFSHYTGLCFYTFSLCHTEAEMYKSSTVN